MLRDTITAVSGLEEAIVATAHLAPPEIRAAIGDLVLRLERQPLSASLAQLADDLDDPTADLVIAALALAARGEAKELADLLSSLAETARDNASMRVRVDAVRARTRTAVRIISGVTVVMVALLLILNRSYLKPFDTAAGQADPRRDLRRVRGRPDVAGGHVAIPGAGTVHRVARRRRGAALMGTDRDAPGRGRHRRRAARHRSSA